MAILCVRGHIPFQSRNQQHQSTEGWDSMLPPCYHDVQERCSGCMDCLAFYSVVTVFNPVFTLHSSMTIVMPPGPVLCIGGTKYPRCNCNCLGNIPLVKDSVRDLESGDSILPPCCHSKPGTLLWQYFSQIAEASRS